MKTIIEIRNSNKLSSMEISSCLKQIEDLRRGMNDMVKNVENEERKYKEKEDKREKNRRNVERVSNMQKDKDENGLIRFDLDGKEIICYKEDIVSCGYETKIMEFISNSANNNKVIHINRSRRYFKYILQIIQSKYDSLSLNENDVDNDKRCIKNKKLISIENDKISSEIMLFEIQYYFTKRSIDDLFNDYIIKVNNEILYIEGYNKIAFLSDIILPTIENEEMIPYSITSINDINKQDHTLYIPANQTLILQFNKLLTITQITLCPFWGDLTNCFPGDGANESIYGGITFDNYNHLGRIPYNYGMNIEDSYTITFSPIKVTYIKFAPTTDLSIASIYIN